MRKLSTEKRAAILAALVEGNSVNATARLTGASKITVLRLLADAGTFAARYHDEHVRGQTPDRVEVDEIWSFIHCKAKNVPVAKANVEGAGDCWAWTAIDADTKLMLSYHVGGRTHGDALEFMLDLASRVTNVTQVTSDGYTAYPPAIREAFGGFVHYAQLQKIYRATRPDRARYSPAQCIGITVEYVEGAPAREKISTSIVERQNLTMRMAMRRYTRLTNGHSKKLDNHRHAVALHFFHYNFCRKHATIKTTPAVACGLADKPITLVDFVRMLEAEEQRTGGRLTDYLPAAD